MVLMFDNTLVQKCFLLLSILVSCKKGYTKEFPLKAANVLFLIDQSNSIWHFNFLRELRFVQETVQRFEIGLPYTRVAVATYAENIHIRIRFRDYKNVEDLTAKIGRIQRPDAPYTRLAVGLRGFHRIFSNHANRCPSNPSINRTIPRYNHFINATSRRERDFYLNKGEGIKTSRQKRSAKQESEQPLNVVVVIGDGDYYDVKRVGIMISCLRSEGVSIFAVGVGMNIKKDKLDRLVTFPPTLYRFNINHRDPKVLPQDTISNSKPAKIWEFMIKNKAMSEDCLPYRSRVQLNFVFDIMSKNSWRYPVLVGLAEDMFIRMVKKYQAVNRKGDFVRIRFYPRSYGSNRTILALNKSTWEEDDMKRYRKLLKESIEMRAYKNEKEAANKMDNGSENVTVERNAWDRLNKAIFKIIKGSMEQDTPKVQQVVIYVNDRSIESHSPAWVVADTQKLVKMNKNVATKRKFELFVLAFGGFFQTHELEKVLRKFKSNPQGRLFAFESLRSGYYKEVKNFVDLFCNPNKTPKIKTRKDRKLKNNF